MNNHKLFKTFYFSFVALLLSLGGNAQSTKKVTADTANYDDLYAELDYFFDSLYTPRSFATLNVGVGNSFYNYVVSNNSNIAPEKQLTLNPLLAYFHKSGWGVSASSAIVKNNQSFNPYQFSINLSYDHIKNQNLVAGFGVTRYFTKDSLPFYTSPLQNEAMAYVTYRKGWLKPVLAINYGVGSHTKVEEQQTFLKKLKKKDLANLPLPLPNNSTETKESVSDLAVTLSVKHDFTWFEILGKKDNIRFSPQLLFISGTQKFGFNQTTSTVSYIGNKKSGYSILYNTESMELQHRSKFKPLVVAAMFKTDYTIGKLSVQPQVTFNYYLPGSSQKLNTLFLVSTGFTL